MQRGRSSDGDGRPRSLSARTGAGRSPAWAVLLLVLCAGLVQLAVLRPRLPERVASHFDLRGEVDGWMSPTAFVVTFAALELVLAGVFLAVGEMVRRVSVRFINLPNAAHWLAPEREAGTRRAVERDLLLLGAGTLLLLLFAVQESYRVSTTSASALRFWPVFGTYFALVGVWMTWFLLRYSRVPRHER